MTLTLERIEVVQGSFRLAADLRVRRGERVAVIGPSGAGKSTLLAVIAGIVRPAAGRVIWEGTDLTRLPPGERPLSILFQDQNLFPHLTVAANLALGIRPSAKLSPGERAAVETALSRVGLEGLGGRRPGTLSGGEQGRVALARALLRRRPLLLLDEPFAALGPALKGEMLTLVAEVVAETGATLLMVTHDPEDARRLCPSTIVVADGVAHPPRSTGLILKHPPPALAAYLGPR